MNRELIEQCGVESVVSDSRFLSESALQDFLVSLMDTAETNDKIMMANHHQRTNKTYLNENNTPFNTPFNTPARYNENRSTDSISPTPIMISEKSQINNPSGRVVMQELHETLVSLYNDLPPASVASCAWLEMLVVETALRNRDRFALLWPPLSMHYRRMVGPLRVIQNPSVVNQMSGKSTYVPLNYASER